MALTVSVSLTVDEAVLLRECVEHMLAAQRFNAGAVAATEEEKLEAGRTIIRLETVRRKLE